ncbi:MAG: hypothetical protein AAGA73_20660 [Pseudomonadota bacterium]
MISSVLDEVRSIHLARFRRAAATIGCLLLVLTGCNASSLGTTDLPTPVVPKKVASQASSLPHYRPGTWFAFDDGSRDEVIMAAGEHVIWENENRNWEMRYRNPALPRLRWSRGSAIVLAKPTSLWPLEAGQTVRFNVLRETRKKDGEVARRKQIWRCQVNQPARIQTDAGAFETYPIACERLSRGRSEKRLRTRTFHYAPAIGHYVQYSTTNRNGVTTSRKLIRYHLEGSADAQ